MFKILTVLVLFTIGINAEQPPEITTSLGKIVGHWQKSYNGRQYMAFEGVPYAKPPIGKHRFEKPTPVSPWKGVWNATNLYQCLQIRFDEGNRIDGNEDCLYLNIYVPRSELKSNEQLDVILHIHGGGFSIGSGNHLVHPGYLMDRDVVFVTINYRLGVFGFLSTGDEVVPGNAGLRDQILALKWVQEHISSFGGNPNSVTITGMSAGGASVHFHYLSPLSKGLFHRGVSHSGVALNIWALQKQNPIELTRTMAQTVGCPIENTKDLVECLINRPSVQILNTIKSLNGFLLFLPVVDDYADNPVLPQHPYVLIKEKKFNDLPWIASNTANEGIFFNILFNDGRYENSNFYDISPKAFFIFNKDKQILDNIKNYYAGNGQNFTTKSMAELLTDRYFLCDTEKAVNLQSKSSNSSVYYYYFNYRSELSFTQTFTKDKRYLGVSHMDDGIYMFPNVAPGELNEKDIKMKDAFIDMLTSFANTGVPKFPEIDWQPTKGDQLTYLNISGIGSEMQLKTAKEISPVTLWDTLEEYKQFTTKDDL